MIFKIIKILVLLGLAFGAWMYFTNGEELTCVPAECFHADSCVSESEAPDCTGLVGTLECVSGTLDCGQGHCEYSSFRRKCIAVID